MGLLRRLVLWNRALSAAANRALGPRLATDGNADFRTRVCPRYVRPGDRVYDLGGGKQPFFGTRAKRALGLTVVGVDLSADELARAEAGAYDRAEVADLQAYRGAGDGDLVVCQALLEHVPDVPRAVRAIRSCLRPGGTACVFVPCRNAPFAVLNRLLPQGLKRRVLFALHPGAREGQGFPSWYDRCTPAELEALFRAEGLEPVEERVYFKSTYFFFCFPLYLAWQLWAVLASVAAPRVLCETATLVLRLPAEASAAADGPRADADAVASARPAAAPAPAPASVR